MLISTIILVYLTFEIDAYTFRTLNSKFHKSSTLFSSSSDSPNQKPPKRRIADVFRIFLLCPVPQDQKPINDYINLRSSLNDTWNTPFWRLFRWYDIAAKLEEPIVLYEEGSWLVSYNHIKLVNALSMSCTA